MAGTLLAVLAFGMSHFRIFWRMEAWTLDLRHQLLAAPTPAADKVAIIVIDEYSIREMLKKEKVSFPWPRDVYEAGIAY
jgi:CHASE2 domain-containing sensor protein